jgi:thiol-disulfide isomerase/thioredoxin
MDIPNFTVYDEKGNTYKLSDFIGKPIVLNFWASWCGPCQGEMPDFNEMYLELGDQVVFLMINATGSDTYQDALNFIRQQGYQFPVYYDKRGEAARRYNLQYLPMTIFISTEGKIVNRWTGALNRQHLERYISEIYTPATETE